MNMNVNLKLKQELIDITSKLISKKTVSPFGNEYRCTPYLKKKMKEIGLKVVVKSKKKGRDNVIGRIGKGKKTLLIAAHMDTVKAGDNWKTDPFKAVVKNGRIYGRGAIDDKGPFAVAYCAVKEFTNEYSDFDGKIILASVADEEYDNEYGIKYLLKNKLIKADAGLIPDGGYLNQFDYGEKGCVQIVIESFGKQEHSALQENGQNAIENLVFLINLMQNKLKFNKFDKRFSKLKMNVSLFNGGSFANVIAGKARAQMDIRFPYKISSKDVISKIKKLIEIVEKRKKAKFKLKIIYTTEPHVVNDNELIYAFKKAGNDINMPIEAITLAGNSVAKELTEGNIPSIVHYPMDKITAHEPNEYIEISKMIKTVKLYRSFLVNYFGCKIN